MTAGTRYYAIVDYLGTRENPAGIARRQTGEDGGISDEALNRDLNWRFSPVIVEWERAESTADLVEISSEEAEQIIKRFRAKWGSPS
jgi:hypothetical protein